MTMPAAVRRIGSLLVLLAAMPGASPVDAATDHGAGIAVIASEIGGAYAVEDLAAFVETARIRDVIIDWAWITSHWDLTKFARVNEFVQTLRKRGVRVAAMYRPRFHAPEIGKHDIPHQVDGDGRPLRGFCEIRYSDPAARRWGTAWALRILRRCPAINEVVIYNPTQNCGSPDAVAARKKDADFDRRCVRTFLEETRAAMRQVKKSARIGLVLPPDPEVYAACADAIDVARPFVFVREGADFGAVRDRALAIAPGEPALAKITWGEGERVSDERLSSFIGSAREKNLRFVFWTFWTTFCQGTYDLDVLCRALGIDPKKIRPIVRDLGGVGGVPWDPAVVARAVREAADDASNDCYFRMLEVADRYGADAVRPLCALLADPDELDHVRWRAAGALGKIGSAVALPCLLKHSRDGSPMVRWMCAEALGACGLRSEAARRRLAEMAEDDPALRTDPETGAPEWYVRATARLSLRLVAESLIDPVEGVAVVAVKDFLRIENNGEDVEKLEFPRYFPKIDSEQVVVGRWATARTDDGRAVPIELVGVTPDSSENLIHTWRVKTVPARTGVVVTLTSLVLRRERPPPRGRFRILPAERLPEAVRPWLASTPAICVDHPEIRAAADAILGETKDAFQIAAAVAALMKGKSYREQGEPDRTLPASVLTLRHGGSCCRSAVTAVALLRACGIPARITYCPAGYIHGIVDFHLDRYGWCRMDATCGTGRLPLVTEREHRGLIRLFDMPIEMERRRNSWGWPYHSGTVEGKYDFRSGGKVVPHVRFAARDEAEARAEQRVAGHVAEPFPHLESGSWFSVLAVEPWKLPDSKWRPLAAASRMSARTRLLAEFPEVLRRLRRISGTSWWEVQLRRLKALE